MSLRHLLSHLPFYDVFSPTALKLLGWHARLYSSPFCSRSFVLWLTLRRGSGCTPLSPTSSVFPSLPRQSAFQTAWVSKLCFRSHTVTKSLQWLQSSSRSSFCPFTTFTPPLPSLSHTASATLASSLFLEHDTKHFQPRAFALLIIFCLDLSPSRSLCDSLSHLLYSLLKCYFWDIPYTLYETLSYHISHSLPCQTLFFSFQMYYHSNIMFHLFSV